MVELEAETQEWKVLDGLELFFQVKKKKTKHIYTGMWTSKNVSQLWTGSSKTADCAGPVFNSDTLWQTEVKAVNGVDGPDSRSLHSFTFILKVGLGFYFSSTGERGREKLWDSCLLDQEVN